MPDPTPRIEKTRQPSWKPDGEFHTWNVWHQNEPTLSDKQLALAMTTGFLTDCSDHPRFQEYLPAVLDETLSRLSEPKYARGFFQYRDPKKLIPLFEQQGKLQLLVDAFHSFLQNDVQPRETIADQTPVPDGKYTIVTRYLTRKKGEVTHTVYNPANVQNGTRGSLEKNARGEIVFDGLHNFGMTVPEGNEGQRVSFDLVAEGKEEPFTTSYITLDRSGHPVKSNYDIAKTEWFTTLGMEK